MNEKKNQFIKVMREHSNEELQNILTRKRTDYVSDALEAAEEVLKERGVEVNLYNINGQISVNAERGGSTDADMYMRLFGYLIDLIAIIAIYFVIIFLHSIMAPLSDFDEDLYYWVVFVFYYISLEYVNNGKTIGKIVLKMRVVSSRGNEFSISQICLRLVCRFIPFDAFSFLWEGNWHDKLSGTKVVKTTINSADDDSITNINDEQPKIGLDSVDFKCPVCGNAVEKYAKVCPFCHETIWQSEDPEFFDISADKSVTEKLPNSIRSFLYLLGIGSFASVLFFLVPQFSEMWENEMFGSVFVFCLLDLIFPVFVILLFCRRKKIAVLLARFLMWLGIAVDITLLTLTFAYGGIYHEIVKYVFAITFKVLCLLMLSKSSDIDNYLGVEEHINESKEEVLYPLPKTLDLEEEINSHVNDNRSKIIFPRLSGKVITTIFIVLFIVLGIVSLFWNGQGKDFNNDTVTSGFVSQESSIVENGGNQTTMKYVDMVRQNIADTEYPVQIADSVVLVGQCVDGDTVVNTIQYVGLVGPLNIEELRMGLISDLKSLDNEELQIIQEEGVFLKYEFVNENGKGIGNIVISPNLLK